MYFLITAALLLGILLSCSTVAYAASPENEFWKWFQENDKRLYDFEKDQDRIFDSLAEALSKVHANLTFEFGAKTAEGKREFVISAGGIKTAFPNVEALFAAAPKFERWTIIKFRPRGEKIYDVRFNQSKVKASEVKYLFFKDERPEKVGIMIFLPGYRKEKKSGDLDQIGYIFLDQALGEYDVEMKVGAVVFEEGSSKYFEKAHPISEMGAEFDDHFKTLELAKKVLEKLKNK